MSKNSDADMCSYNGEFLSVPHRTHTTQHKNKYNIEQRQRETDKEDRESETGQGRDGTGRDCRQMATLRESWLPITHACYDFLTTFFFFFFFFPTDE